MKAHQKHANLERPDFGFFGRREWAILGTNCGAIQDLSKHIVHHLSAEYKIAYVDASHQQHDEGDAAGPAFLPEAVYTDMIDYHRLDTRSPMDSYQYRQWFNTQDIVLVNGNHFAAKRQFVVIDEKKKASLQRKVNRLTKVEAFLLAEGEQEVFDFLKELIPDWGSIPIFRLAAHEEISAWLKQEMEREAVPLYGLVLAGGKSQRMGNDKAWIEYHGQPQVKYVQNLLEHFCAKTFISCRPDQQSDFPEQSVITDTMLGLGPFGAIASAFQKFPNVAWLVMAVDIPLADKSFLQELVERRNTSKFATAFLNPATGFPDPLLTIWEPRSYLNLLQFLGQGYSCPRKVLINSDIELLASKQPEKLKNVNDPEAYAEVRALLEK